MSPKCKSKVKRYNQDEIDNDFYSALELHATEELRKPKPFSWQLTASASIYKGRDIIINAGTGCGKSTCWELAILKDKQNIVLVVSPLSALMLDQVQS